MTRQLSFVYTAKPFVPQVFTAWHYILMGHVDSKTRGFALTEALVGFILLSILGLYFSSLFNKSLRAETSIQNSFDFASLNQSILNILMSAFCPTSLVKADGSPLHAPFADPIEIRAGAERVAYVGKNLGNQAVITQLSLEILSGPAPQYLAALKVAVSRNPQSYGGDQINNFSNPIILNLLTTNAGQLIACGGSLGGFPSPSLNTGWVPLNSAVVGVTEIVTPVGPMFRVDFSEFPNTLSGDPERYFVSVDYQAPSMHPNNILTVGGSGWSNDLFAPGTENQASHWSNLTGTSLLLDAVRNTVGNVQARIRIWDVPI